MMDSNLFTEVYGDTVFNKNASAMLKRIYFQNRSFLQDEAIDLDDFIQEMWCELFEEKRFMPDRAWCMEAMKGNALNYINSIRDKLHNITIFEYTGEDSEVE